MHIHLLTLFPEMFSSYFAESMLKRAQTAGHLTLHLHQLRHFASDKHHTTDDTPFGGGGGMVLLPEPIFRAVEEIPCPRPVILMSPQGRVFTQKVAQELAQLEAFTLLCGRYEGVDERVRQHLVDDEISIGDYVLTGGELAAMVITDAVIRLRPGVLGAEGGATNDSHAIGLLEGAHYTRPENFRGWRVPEVLRSGHGAKIARWRREEALRRTWQTRPEMLLTAPLTEEDKQFLAVLALENMKVKI